MQDTPALLQEKSFAVVDVETTGFSPRRGDRIIEIAVVRIEPETTHEYETLVNPLRDPGPAHVHGLTAEDLTDAPIFEEILGDLLEIMSDAVMVAHNIRFDRDFIAAELSAAGVFLPSVPSLCTLGISYRLQPALTNHRLATCCAALGVRYTGSHSAIGDARAEAELLRRYLANSEHDGLTTLEALGCDPSVFPAGQWPQLPCTGRRRIRTGRRAFGTVPYLAGLVASLGAVTASERLAPYMDLLDRVLEDVEVTEAEADALRETAVQWGLSTGDLITTHHSYLEALVTTAVQDGQVTERERRELETVTRLLAVDPAILHALLVRGLEDPG